jgi:hypothetical protein
MEVRLTAPQKLAASQFLYGTRVSVPTFNSAVRAVRLKGKVVGWGSSNTTCLVRLEFGEESYFRIADIQELQAKQPDYDY